MNLIYQALGSNETILVEDGLDQSILCYGFWTQCVIAGTSPQVDAKLAAAPVQEDADMANAILWDRTNGSADFLPRDCHVE